MIARYPRQLEYKKDVLKQSLIKYAQVNPRKIQNVLPSADIFGYRNQFKMPCAMEENRLGIDCLCPIQIILLISAVVLYMKMN